MAVLTNDDVSPGGGPVPILAGSQVHRAVPSLTCVVSRCEPGWSWRPTMADHDLWFVVHGRGEARYLGQVHDLHPGSLVWLRPGTTGEFTQDRRHRLTVVACHFDLVDTLGSPVRGELDLPGPYVEIGDIAALSTVLRRLVRVMHQVRARTRPGVPSGGPGEDPLRWAWVEAEGLLLQALAMVGREHAGTTTDLDPRLAETIEMIMIDPASRPNLAELAVRVGLSARQLSRLFRTELGTTFREFVVEVRLQRAHTLLSETPMTVTQIALALGYPDHVLLSRQFRARFGQPPSAVRRSVHTSAPEGMAELTRSS